ncbi:MAG: hypothetical protein ACRCZF_13360 [Gemmataceae bacterium]
MLWLRGVVFTRAASHFEQNRRQRVALDSRHQRRNRQTKLIAQCAFVLKQQNMLTIGHFDGLSARLTTLMKVLVKNVAPFDITGHPFVSRHNHTLNERLWEPKELHRLRQLGDRVITGSRGIRKGQIVKRVTGLHRPTIPTFNQEPQRPLTKQGVVAPYGKLSVRDLALVVVYFP